MENLGIDMLNGFKSFYNEPPNDNVTVSMDFDISLYDEQQNKVVTFTNMKIGFALTNDMLDQLIDTLEQTGKVKKV